MLNNASIPLAATSAAWQLPSRRKVAVAWLIVTESAMFTIFVVAYLFYLGKSLTGPSPAQVLETPVISTLCLLGSSVTIMWAAGAFRCMHKVRFRLWWTFTIGLAAVFLAATAAEWYRLITVHHLTIRTNVFGTTFYALDPPEVGTRLGVLARVGQVHQRSRLSLPQVRRLLGHQQFRPP